MNRDELLSKSIELIQWVDSQLDGQDVPATMRGRLAAGALYTAQQHHRAIILLACKKILASAFALMRPMNEAYVRGIWLSQRASDTALEKFVKTSKIPKHQELIDQIEKLESFQGGELSELKRSNWKFMNDFTHTGAQQIIRHNTEESVEQCFEDAEIFALINHSNAIGVLTGIEIMRLLKL